MSTVLNALSLCECYVLFDLLFTTYYNCTNDSHSCREHFSFNYQINYHIDLKCTDSLINIFSLQKLYDRTNKCKQCISNYDRKKSQNFPPKKLNFIVLRKQFCVVAMRNFKRCVFIQLRLQQQKATSSQRVYDDVFLFYSWLIFHLGTINEMKRTLHTVCMISAQQLTVN